mmetsp:Transcript_30585/g.69996  ORF Transcript_30585/g.69996 Transcript_30585/m.69996 type:complete len:313 (-) Transcript_30585:352-1290(-)|eukprot:CAMPEP_0113305094 /NCGR_PEP_ID=MMETSP0010_2-20120614/4846_1 /TAXON_ID=216773 ORGANISM="Corethron hystrix, Strain 308" /NCGR_SAMPLE_ID=MMETSP0010_2 /ASSEMBLY_ACC=CAM_ASM_000155 /LENGTH=312 /DNA_ID=CAMNT_0000159419 /DNA_START=188 /DNA_END=1129 /DNA_ORIENTATION=- /assembly_acc=CAM_ASM_000155
MPGPTYHPIPQPLYKLAKTSDVSKWTSQGFLAGSDLDKRDGFLHASNPAMIVKVASMFFSGETDVEIVRIPASALPEKTRWAGGETEEAECQALVAAENGPDSVVRMLPDGCMHLHLRRPLDYGTVENLGVLPVDEEGNHIFPDFPNHETSTEEVKVVRMDYDDSGHASALRLILAQYAEDPMGGGEALDPAVLEKLPAELAKIPHALSLLASVGGRPAGLMNCFMGFSTFCVKPLINIHDCAVLPVFRRRGVCVAMMQHLEVVAKERGCCKITLEVLEGNVPAKSAYKKCGFEGYELDPKNGNAQFWQKKL